VSGDGGLPRRVGLRDGNRSDSVETPVAIEACLALGREGAALAKTSFPLVGNELDLVWETSA
jgi:hypothetical protein